MAKFNIPAQTIPTVASAYADVIGTTDNQIVEIKNELIIEDNKQKFKIHEDTIDQLAERIAKDGQLSPCIVAPLPNGKYELIDGRHRRRAVIKAGLPTTKCIIKSDLSANEKKTIRLTSNLIRNNDYLPSELAYAYKELAELEDMKTISEETNLSKKKIYRYIRLTNLIEPLLNRVDSGQIPVIAAVELSYLTREQQCKLFEFLLNNSNIKISTVNARFIKENPEAFCGEKKVDNLSTKGKKVSEPSETESSDDYRELAVNALKPYHQNNYADDEDLESISNEEVDNLSTDRESAPEPTEEKKSDDEKIVKSEQSSETTKLPELWFQDKNNNVHSCDEINSEHLKTICEYVIDETHIDYYIFRFAYDSKDVLQLWKENQISRHTGSSVVDSDRKNVGFADWVSSTKRMFQIRIGGDLYIMPHRILEQLVRRYIRENYTLERIQKIITEEH